VVPDVKGDAVYNPLSVAADVPLVPGTPGDDLLSADVASDGKYVTAVLRMVAVQEPDPVAPTGRSYAFSFEVRGLPTAYFLAARTYPTGTRYEYGDYPVDATGMSYVRVLGHGTGSVSAATHEVRVRAPLAGFLPRSVRRGSTLVGLTAGVYRQWGQEPMEDPGIAPVHVPVLASAFDEAEGDRYVVGTPSCVKP
jgi:hypothetical protein